MKVRLTLAAAGLLALAFVLGGSLGTSGGTKTAEAAGVLPAGWPASLQLGMSDSPGGAASLKATAPFAFRYQYLAAGVNTGNGWANWNANGDFAKYYIQDSIANGFIPTFTYYMIFQSAPGNTMGEADGVLTNLQNASTMAAYYNDLKLFFQKAGAFPSNKVVLHVEPDMWGYVQQRATGDNAASVAAKVGGSGMPDVAGYPDTVAGMAQAIIKLRNQYAPNVILGYHVSIWGTGTDIQWSQTPDATTDALATRAGNFYNSLGANFDIAFAEFSDRDAGFKQAIYGDGGRSWFDADDFARHARFLKTFSNVAGKRVVLWQIPLGNTKMRAQNNSWNHYQDNRVEWLLDDPSRVHLQTYIDAGVVAFLFGRGADGATCACDASGDGVTNPSAINGNTMNSLTGDDDGGFFKDRARAYYTTGAMALAGGTPTNPTSTPTPGAPTSTPTSVPPTATRTALPPTATPTTPPATATPTKTSTPAPTATSTPPPATASWTTSASKSTSSVTRGKSITLKANVKSTVSTRALVDLEVYDATGQRVYQKYWDSQSFTANQARSFSTSWLVPTTLPKGTYTVKVGIFAVGWAGMLHWNNSATTFTVR